MLVLLGGWFSVKTIQVSLASEGRLQPRPVDYRVSRLPTALWTQRIWVTLPEEFILSESGR